MRAPVRSCLPCPLPTSSSPGHHPRCFWGCWGCLQAGPAAAQGKQGDSRRRLYGLFIASFRCLPVPTLSSTANKFRSGVHPRKGCTAKDPAPFCRHQQGSAGLHGPISIQHAASHGTGPGCINPGPEQSQQEELEICNVCLCGGA